MITDEDAIRAAEYLRDNASKDAEARANAIYLEQWVKTVKARCQAKHADMSVAAREIEALVDPEYVEALEGYKQALVEDGKRKFLREAAHAKLSAWQTMSANNRVNIR